MFLWNYIDFSCHIKRSDFMSEEQRIKTQKTFLFGFIFILK